MVITGFFAYPSQDSMQVATIKTFINRINNLNYVKLISWEDFAVNGKFVINELCGHILKSDLFCADLTGLNPNVMFELGYAIARGKKVWIILDKSKVESSEFDQIEMLTTIGYSDYCNSEDIYASFMKDKAFDNLDDNIFNNSIKQIISDFEKESILYLLSRHKLDSESSLNAVIRKSQLPITYDDPSEACVQPLSWYVKKIAHSLGVIVHLCSPKRTGAQLHNSKYSFIAGMSLGFEKQLLMLVEEPYASPIDYRDMLRKYKDPNECSIHASNWLSGIDEDYRRKTRSSKEYQQTMIRARYLRNLKLGQPVAENERGELSDYFVETDPYLEALNGRQTLFVGQKGVGKTANMYMLETSLREEKFNFVCVIKPESYKLQSVVRLIRKYQEQDEKGFVIQSLWKYLIFTELALQEGKRIRRLPPSAIDDNSAEAELLELIDSNEELIDEEFSIRLENTVERLLATQPKDSLREFRISISENLHEGILKKLRALLGELFKDRNSVTVLIDNLDKIWDKKENMDSLSELLLGLLGIINDIKNEFSREDFWRKSFPFSLVVFLRTDIFSFIKTYAREPDKLIYRSLKWDKDMLIRVVNERLLANSEEVEHPDQIWKKFFCEQVDGMDLKEYVVNAILPKPRDILIFMNSAISTAINRGHPLVEESDFKIAEIEYSKHVLATLKVESEIVWSELESILSEFLGERQIFAEDALVRILRKAGINEDRQDEIIRILCVLSFMGLETDTELFQYIDDEEEYNRIQIKAKKYAEYQNNYLRYRIHNAYSPLLELK